MRCAQWSSSITPLRKLKKDFLSGPLVFRSGPHQFLRRGSPVWRKERRSTVFARSFQRTGSSRTANVAQKAARSFLYTVREGGVVTRPSIGTCFIEEVAYPPAIHILNGCLCALVGLFEHLRVFPDSQIQSVFEACVRGLNICFPHSIQVTGPVTPLESDGIWWGFSLSYNPYSAT